MKANQPARFCVIPLLLMLGVLLASAAPMVARAQYSEKDSGPVKASPTDYSTEEEAKPDPVAVKHYVIDAELQPESHTLKAKAKVDFEARENLSAVDFELNSNLFPTNITADDGQALSSQRIGDGLRVEITLRKPLRKGEATSITMEYEGPLADADHSPVEGVQLAYIGPEISYLLYPARWFPMAGYETDRYTAEFHLTVPSGMNVVSGGKVQSSLVSSNRVRYDIVFDRPQFGGSIALVNQPPQTVNAEGRTVRVSFSPQRQGMAQAYGQAAAHMMSFFSSKFGPPPVSSLSIVEIGDASLGGYAGPEVIFLAPRAIGTEVNTRLLAQEVAQQWWRGLVSPATKADLWLDHGMATYSEALYLESIGGKQALEDRIREMAIDALTHDEIPIRAASRTQEFSPAYKTLLYDKAAYVLHMLRWVVGDEAFFKALAEFANRFAFGSATTNDFRDVVDQISGQNLDGFFVQWMESTGASDFQADYTIYRIKNGYRIAGKISQDQDLFSMPVEVRIETEGDPVTQRIQVKGKESEFAIETAARPKKILIDPENRVLKFNDDIRVRVAVARGEQLVAQHDYTGALDEYQKALDVNRLSSLAHYRVGEVFFALRNYQSAANAFREALNGDLKPEWTEVWSHLSLGKIFDVTGQRDRAINEYQQAVRTKDNSQGALDLANQYLKSPFERGTQQAADSTAGG